MRRSTIILSASLLLLALAPAAATARHHRRHHSRAHHARVKHFGSDVTASPTNGNSADNAGTVKTFNNGVLTIMLNDGSTVSGALNRDSELECMAPDQSQTMHSEGDGGSGDRSGDGDNSGRSGEDQGDAAEQSENQAEQQSENPAEDQDEGQAENNCSTGNLTPGTTVREAELRVSGTGNTWKKVELGS